jgi:hypothetical protein
MREEIRWWQQWNLHTHTHIFRKEEYAQSEFPHTLCVDRDLGPRKKKKLK